MEFTTLHSFVILLCLIKDGDCEFNYYFADEGAVTPGNYSIEENTEPGTLVTTLEATQPAMFYMDNKYLAIDNETGVITIKDGVVLDYEGMLPDITFEANFTVLEIVELKKFGDGKDSYWATPHPPRVLTGSLSVTVTDINEPPEFDITNKYTNAFTRGFTVLNNSRPRTRIGSVEATDQDLDYHNGMIRAYQIQNADTPFTVSNKGTLRIQYGRTVDVNETRVWTLVIETADDGTPSLTSSTTVYVGVCHISSQSDITGSWRMVLLATAVYLVFSSRLG